MAIVIFTSFEDELLPDKDETVITNVDPYAGGVQFENPYVLQNMRNALQIIKEKVDKGIYHFIEYKGDQNRAPFDISNFQVALSHKYIKFTPQTEADVAILKRDSTIVLSDYPLDYDFPESYFQNRQTPSETYIPEYFAILSLNKTIPSVNHQVLGDLYLPEQDPYFEEEGEYITKESQIGNEEDLLHHLLYEAYVLAGKEQFLLEDGGSFEGNGDGNRFWVFGRKWYPNGNVKMFDHFAGTVPASEYCYDYTYFDFDDCPFTAVGGDGVPADCGSYVTETICDQIPSTQGIMIPMDGVQVLMRQLFTVRQGITDVNGNFSTDYVRGKARYVIQWERYHYSIRDGLVFQAELHGPNVKQESHNFVITEGEDLYHATIQEAAHEYYYGNTLGTHRPQLNGGFQSQMKIAATNGNNNSIHIPEINNLFLGVLPKILIKAWESNTERCYGTTIHELAHSAHRALDKNTYDALVFKGYIAPCIAGVNPCEFPIVSSERSARRLMETWARTIEIEMTLNRYRNKFGQTNYAYLDTGFLPQIFNSNYQNRTVNDAPFYTSAGRDMIDNVNQRDVNNNYPIDNVSGVNLQQLENGLIDATNWQEWRDRIFSQNPNNNTRGDLQELFNNWD